MSQTKNCIICLEPAIRFGGHLHIGDKTITAGLCRKHQDEKHTACDLYESGCYGEWKEEMGNTADDEEPSTYGTDKSWLLGKIIEAGHKPLAITVMICEETFVFKTKKETDDAWEFVKSKYGNEGWWYHLDEWDETRKDYVKKFYKGVEEDAPKVYWL